MASAGDMLPKTVSRTATLMVVFMILTWVALECRDSNPNISREEVGGIAVRRVNTGV
jgi:hypothetical protein